MNNDVLDELYQTAKLAIANRPKTLRQKKRLEDAWVCQKLHRDGHSLRRISEVVGVSHEQVRNLLNDSTVEQQRSHEEALLARKNFRRFWRDFEKEFTYIHHPKNGQPYRKLKSVLADRAEKWLAERFIGMGSPSR